MIEINYVKTSDTGRQLRRQLLEIADGWTLSNAVVLGEGPDSLRGYDGGWHWSDTVYADRQSAERVLKYNGWVLEGEPPAALTRHSRTRAVRAASGSVSIEVAITVEQRAAIDAEAAELGLSRAATVAKWADSLAKKRARKNRTLGVK